MHPAGESFLFEQEQKYRSEKKKKAALNSHFLRQPQPSIATRLGNFLSTLNHIRRIRIQVTFEYQDLGSEAVVGYKPTV